MGESLGQHGGAPEALCELDPPGLAAECAPRQRLHSLWDCRDSPSRFRVYGFSSLRVSNREVFDAPRIFSPVLYQLSYLSRTDDTRRESPEGESNLPRGLML